MAVLPSLRDPASYSPHFIDTRHDAASLAHWISVFHKQAPRLIACGAESLGGGKEAIRIATVAAETFLERARALAGQPNAPTLLALCELREATLRECGLADPYAPLKRDANQRALSALPALLRDLDAYADSDRVLALVQGFFAGNLFDVGAVQLDEELLAGRMDFATALGQLRQRRLSKRPWFHDDFDALAHDLVAGFAQSLIFVDNAGADVVLGALPFARELLRRGGRVALAANATPALNDVTYPELEELLQAAADTDAVIARGLQAGELLALSSGGSLPLLDLRHISEDAAAYAATCDLIVLEGMGRALESNFDAEFRCAALKIAVVKDPQVAAHLGAELYDLVCRYDAPLLARAPVQGQ